MPPRSGGPPSPAQRDFFRNKCLLFHFSSKKTAPSPNCEACPNSTEFHTAAVWLRVTAHMLRVDSISLVSNTRLDHVVSILTQEIL